MLINIKCHILKPPLLLINNENLILKYMKFKDITILDR